MVILLFLLVVWFGLVWLAAYIAQEKGRSTTEGVLLGLFLGIIGVLIEALLPSKLAQPVQVVYQAGGTPPQFAVSMAPQAPPPPQPSPWLAPGTALHGQCGAVGCPMLADYRVTLRGEDKGAYCQAHARVRSRDLHKESGGWTANIERLVV